MSESNNRTFPQKKRIGFEGSRIQGLQGLKATWLRPWDPEDLQPFNLITLQPCNLLCYFFNGSSGAGSKPSSIKYIAPSKAPQW